MVQYSTTYINKKKLGHIIIHNLHFNEQNFSLHLNMLFIKQEAFPVPDTVLGWVWHSVLWLPCKCFQ